MGEPSVETLYEQVRAAMPAASGEVPDTLQPVAPEIRVLALRTPTLPPAAHTNTYVVGPQRGGQAVIDPGTPYPDQQSVLNDAIAAETDAGRPLSLILLTHHHGDHVGGATALAQRWGVPIAAHAKTAARLAGRVEITRLLADGEVLDEFAITCVHTPGHADGHLCFEHGAASIVGDMVAGLGWILIDPVEGNMADYLRSLEQLLARPPVTLLPAHGPMIADGPSKLREYIRHRTLREDRVLAALAGKQADVAALLPEVYADTPKLLWPLAERSLRAHIDKLVREHRVRESAPGRWTAG
jgi:glyoxylase-like metal-dependent hydrolase (beta-lactamase superfamily II)